VNVIEARDANVGYGLGKPASVSGFLVVADAIAYLAESSSQQHGSILVIAPWLVGALLDNDVPCSAGSMHLFSGVATVSGQLVASGLPLVPLAFYQVSSVSLTTEGGVVELRA